MWKPSVMPLFLVKRHMVAMSSRQACCVLPSWTSEGRIADMSSAMRAAAAESVPRIFLVQVFFQQQITQLLFEAIDHFQCRIFSEILSESGLLLRPQVVPMASHQRKQTPIL